MKKKILTKTNKSALIIAVLFVCFAWTPPTFAQSGTSVAKSVLTPVPVAATAAQNTQSDGAFVPLTQFPQIKTLAEPTSFETFINTLYKVCIGAGSVLAVIMIMVAGVQFMTSKGSVASNEKAKSRIQNAILGLVLVLAPTIVFGIINPEILHLNFGTEFSGLQLGKVEQQAFDPQQTAINNAVAAGQAECTTVKKIKLATVPSGQDAGKTCSAIGKGWSSYGSQCGCNITSADQVCCGYDPANDQNTTAAPVAPEAQSGVYRYTMYWGGRDGSDQDNGYCVYQSTDHQPTQEACTASLNRSIASYRTLIYAVSNNCDGSKVVRPVIPQSDYDKLRKLHSC